VTESSTLIELLVKGEHVREAAGLAENMLKRDTYPMPKIFRFLLNKLAANGEVELMNRVGRYLSPKVKKEVSFDNRLCNAYL
jgi:leucine-rich PPR motif-containing protein